MFNAYTLFNSKNVNEFCGYFQIMLKKIVMKKRF